MKKSRVILGSLLLCAAAAWGMWRAFAAMAVATSDGSEDRGLQQLHFYERYVEPARILSGCRQAGYVAGPEAENSVAFHFARLAVIPCVLHVGESHATVLLDLPDQASVDEWLAENAGEALWRNQQGLAVVRRADP